MRLPRFPVLIVALGVIGSTACSGDDQQAEPEVADRPAAEETADTAADDAADDAQPAEPPGPPEGWDRPDDLVDLTGMEVVEIEVADNVYRTRDFIVDAGTEIVFVNVGSNDHNVKPSIPDAFPIVPDFGKGESATLRIDTPGDYPFYCSIHGAPGIGHVGYVVVAAP